MSSPFQNEGRRDDLDTTLVNLDNTRYSNYLLSDFMSNVSSDEHVQFATTYPSITFTGVAHGEGLNSSEVDAESILNINKIQTRPLEKVQLYQRPFITVPYMGRGFSNPELESKLMQGENTMQLKSVGTVMEQSFLPYSAYPVDPAMQERVKDARYSVEEAALQGWVRGGTVTRD